MRCLFWFNPAVHFAALWARHDQELACDESVVTSKICARHEYANALLKSQMMSQGQRRSPLACGWGAGPNGALRTRIVALDANSPVKTIRRVGLGVVSALAGAFVIQFWRGAHSPQQQQSQLRFEPIVEKITAEVRVPQELLTSRMAGNYAHYQKKNNPCRLLLSWARGG